LPEVPTAKTLITSNAVINQKQQRGDRTLEVVTHGVEPLPVVLDYVRTI
jgi:hypothetical protein